MNKELIEVFGKYDEGMIGEEKQVSLPGIETGEGWKDREVVEKPQKEYFSWERGIIQHNTPQQVLKGPNKILNHLFVPNIAPNSKVYNLIPLSSFPENPKDEEYSRFRESYKKFIEMINSFNALERNLSNRAETEQKIQGKGLADSILDIMILSANDSFIKETNDLIGSVIKYINSNIKGYESGSNFWCGWDWLIERVNQFSVSYNSNIEQRLSKVNNVKKIINENIEVIKALDNRVGGEELKKELIGAKFYVDLRKWIGEKSLGYIYDIITEFVVKELGFLKEAESEQDLYKKMTGYMPELETWNKMHLRGYYGERYKGGVDGKIIDKLKKIVNHLDEVDVFRFFVNNIEFLDEDRAKELIIKSKEEIIKELGGREIVKKFFAEFLVGGDYDPHSVEQVKGGETGIVERKIEKLGLEKDPELVKFLMWLLREKGINELRDRMIDFTWRLGVKLGKRDLNNLIKIYKYLSNNYDEWSRYDIDFLLAGIRGVETLGRDIRAIDEVLDILHNNAFEVSSEVIKGILGTKNVSKLVNIKGGSGLNIVKKYYELMATILGNGGMSGIMKGRRKHLKELEERGAIKPGFKERMEDFADIIRMGIDINPSKKNYGELVLLINELTSDVETLINYEKYLKYYKEAKKKDERLYLLDKDLGNGLKFRVLRDLDPGHFRVGIETDCCQRIGGAAETSVVDSFINPVAGVLVLEGASGEIIAQSWIHYIAGEGYILDNIEVAPRYEEGYKGIGIEDIYAYWAREKKAELGVRYIQAGSGYSDISGKKFEKIKMEEDPRTFAVEDPYTDWDAGEENIDLTAPKFEVRELGPVYDKVGELIKIFERLTKGGRVDNLGRNVKSWGQSKV